MDEEDERRRPPKVVIVALVVACIAGVGFGGRAVWRHVEAKRAATAWARFSRCLIGARPLDATEALRTRLRLFELGVLERKLSHAEAPGDAQWPQRCAPYGKALARDWEDPVTAMGGPLEQLDVMIEKGHLPTELTMSATYPLDQTFQAAFALHAKPDDVSDVPPPPQQAELLDVAKAAVLSPETQMWDAVPLVDRSVRILPWRRNAMWQIEGTADPATSLLHARAISISPKIVNAERGKLAGVEEGAAPLLAITDFNGRGGLWSLATGEVVVPSLAPTFAGGWAKPNGFAATIEHIALALDGAPKNLPTYMLVRRSPDGKVTRTALDQPKWKEEGVSLARVVGGWIVWQEGTSSRETKLRAREILEGVPAAGPVLEIGPAPPQLLLRDDARVCRTESALFVDLTDTNPTGTGHAIIAFADGRWHAPVLAEGARHLLTCSGKRAFYAGLDVTGPSPYDDSAKAPAEVHRTVCDLDGCKHESVTLPDVVVTRGDIKNAHVSVAALGADVIAMMHEGSLRVGPLADLSHARVRILVDARVQDVVLHSAHLFGRHDLAVLLLGTSRGQHAYRVDTKGALTPVDLIE